MDIVVNASTGALQALLPKLAKLLGDQYKLQTSIKDGIRYLHKELGSMQVALEKVSELPTEQLDPQVKIWASNLRDISYHIQDTIDSYIVRVDPDNDSASSTTCCVKAKGILPHTCMARLDIATQIKRIRKEVEEVSNRHERYKVDGMALQAPSDPRLPALYQDKEKLVGINRSTEQIIKLLSVGGEGASEQKLKLVSIVGLGGMGKTTLANVVYQKLQGEFDCTAFISVSLQPNMKNILSSILRQVTSNIQDDTEDKDRKKDEHKSAHRQESHKHYVNTDTWSEKEIIDKIIRVLEKRRYLIIIDDMWREEPWKLIKGVLFENKLGSKVITTTRNIDIARSCCSCGEFDGIVHELQPLSDGDSQKLFYYKIFSKDGCPTEFEVVSRKILDKCNGWPLGIIAIASLLANKPTQTEDQWWSVYNSISTGLENNPGVKDMRLILSLSYRDMPSQLRSCLLYLSIFLENHIIGRDDLIHRWMAEDLVHGYELGDEYFNQLIQRSMVQPIDVDAFGRAHACQMHSLVLEFVTSLSAQENFVTICNGKQPSPPLEDNIHRLSLRNINGKNCILKSTKMLPHVRTLVVSSCAINSMPSLSIFPVVRVLELEECSTRNIKSLGNLVHLRYLRLSQDYYYGWCIKLPEAIGNLRLLQTLDIKEAVIEELPSTMVQLRQVRVLEISVYNWDKKCEKRFLLFLCNQKELEVFVIFAPDSSLDFMLLADLVPSHLRRFEASSHDKTEHIFREGSVWENFSPFSKLPGWINSSYCSHLSDISIMVRRLGQEDLEILADLHILHSLDLEVVETTGKRLEINGCVGTNTSTGHEFRCLEKLIFASRVVRLVFRPGAMKKLQKLYLCFDVAETKDAQSDFDLGLENLSSLKTVKVEMDCRCARLSEVEDAEAALCKATGQNPPNCPTLDLKRHFEDEMLSDQEEHISEELPAKKEEDALLSRVEPFGGTGGRARDIKVAPHRLENVIIHSGDIVDSLAFSYTDHGRQQRTAGPWGGHGGGVSNINLGPNEYLMNVSGTIGSFYGVASCVTSLTFVTNFACYGPFGKGGGVPFDALPVQSNSSIVGFFGRAGGSLDAIGFYVRPL
ncbi:disease resistance protein Pik-2-like [Triticum dicoccoides]|uniref:disease resistance protein Pik-2-like n=1 Tax=Triticum dicoccoides TaxID=85692 RepID=UPI00189091AD|nr:disease resistance protein Pik-2-like [Triticum dicoccoides]